MILLHALEIAGPVLKAKYPGPMRELGRILADPNSQFNKDL